jgi:hypothetical protein
MCDIKEKREIHTTQNNHEPATVISDDFSLDNEQASGKKYRQD